MTYNFSCEELKEISRVIRSRQCKIPPVLFNFCRRVQNEVYNCLSIDEVEEFYKNENDE